MADGPNDWKNSFANAVLGAGSDPSQEDTAETRAASGLGQVAQYALDSGPMPQPGTPEYASGQATPDIDVTDLVPSKAALAGGAKLAGAGAMKLAAALKAKGAAAGLPLAMGAIKKATKGAAEGVLKIRGKPITEMTLSQLQIQALKAAPSSPVQLAIREEINKRHAVGESVWHPDGPIVAKVAAEELPIDKARLKKGEYYAAGGMVAGGSTQTMADGGQMADIPPQAPADPIDAFLAAPVVPHTTADVPPPGLDEFIAPEMQQAKYGTLGQQAIAGVEGVAQGVAGPLATAFETKVLGVDPADIRGREQANVGTHVAGQVVGFVGPAVATAGLSAAGKGAGALAKGLEFTQAGLLNKAGSAIEATTIGNQIAKDVAREAFVSGLFQGGEEINRAFKEDPDQTAEGAIANIGLATAMGGVFGGATGAAMRAAKTMPKPFVSQADAPKLEAGDLGALVKHEPGFTAKERESILGSLKFLGREKKEAGAIRKVAEAHGLPVAEGMVSDNQLIQRAEDALLTGGNTWSSVKRQELYDRGYRQAEHLLDEAVGAGSNVTKAELGETLATSLKAKIKDENAPISQMYQALKARTEAIPLARLEAEGIKAELAKIPEFRVTPNSPQGQLAKRIMADLDNVQTVDDLMMLKSSIHDSLTVTAAPGERRMAAILSDKLKTLADDSIQQHALSTARSAEELAAAQALPAARKAADAAYRPFIEKVQNLAKQLGKSRVHGAQDAINFIDNLDYEQVASRLFNKNKSQFVDFFAKEFPAEFELMKGYQKGLLREAAMREGVFSPLTFFNKFNALPAEIQKALFSGAEIKRIADMETYLRSFPKRFNPSGTAAAMNLRASFQPKQFGLANLQDLGIEKFIKMSASMPDVNAAMQLAKATVAADKAATKGIQAIISGGKSAIPGAILPVAANRDKLMKLVNQYTVNPEKALAMNDSNPVPEYQTAFAATAARAAQYLAANRPDNSPKSPLDSAPVMSSAQKAEFDNMVDIAQQPLSVLSKMASNTLSPKDVQTLQAIYPSLYRSLAQKMIEGIAQAKEKGQEIPYAAKLQMSMFLAQPLDSTLTPMGIMSAQTKGPKNQEPTSMMPGSGPKHSMKALDKLAKSYETDMQASASKKLGK